MTLRERWLEAKASLDTIKAWHAIIIAVVVAGLFSFYGPRAGDDRRTAVAMAVVELVKDTAIKSCNEEARENEDKANFTRSASFDLILQEQGFDHEKRAVVTLREKDYACGYTIGGDAFVTLDDDPTP